MEHRRDRLILIATVLKHQASDDQQVRQVRDLSSYPPLAPVDL